MTATQTIGSVPSDCPECVEKDVEIDRLARCIQWEQNRAGRIGTHGPGCWSWGPAHYECALRHIRGE